MNDPARDVRGPVYRVLKGFVRVQAERPKDAVGVVGPETVPLQGAQSDCVLRAIWSNPAYRYLRSLPSLKDLPPAKAYARFVQAAERASGVKVRSQGMSFAQRRTLMTKVGIVLQQAKPASADQLAGAVEAGNGVVGAVYFRVGGMDPHFSHAVTVTAALRAPGGPWRFVVLNSHFARPRLMSFEELQLVEFWMDFAHPLGKRGFGALPADAEAVRSLIADAEAALFP